MKIELTAAGYGSKVLDDEGNDLTKKLGVRAITVECEVNQPTRAIMEMIMIEQATVNPAVVEYHVGGYSRVKGLIMEDGALHYFPGYENSPRREDAAGNPARVLQKILKEVGVDTDDKAFDLWANECELLLSAYKETI